MFWHTSSSSKSRKAITPQANIDTAIRIYENSRTPREEEQSLSMLEKAFTALFIFTERDCNDTLRENHKVRRDEMMKRFREIIQQRKSGLVSKYKLVRELKALCKSTDRTE